MRLDLFVKLKYQSNTNILSFGIKHSVRDLFCGVINYMPNPQTCDVRHIYTVYDISAPFGNSLP